VGSGEAQDLTNEVGQEEPGLNLRGVLLTVDGDRHLFYLHIGLLEIA
jgi:hypothetical protein